MPLAQGALAHHTFDHRHDFDDGMSDARRIGARSIMAVDVGAKDRGD
jgi:hypothetical protein